MSMPSLLLLLLQLLLLLLLCMPLLVRVPLLRGPGPVVMVRMLGVPLLLLRMPVVLVLRMPSALALATTVRSVWPRRWSRMC